MWPCVVVVARGVVSACLSSHAGVRGRLVELCRPTSKRYQTAVTRVLGKQAESIVVDTEDTCFKCIQVRALLSAVCVARHATRVGLACAGGSLASLTHEHT